MAFFCRSSFSLLITLILFSGCKTEPAKPPVPAVTISKPLQHEVTEWDEYSGRLESPTVANVSARVGGLVIQTPFLEGSLVTQGDLLFVIDDRSYKAELTKAEAAVAIAQAQLLKSQSYFNRLDKLKGTNAVSADELDQSRATLEQMKAAYNAALALQDMASLDLEWTKVTAPISGRVGRKLVTEGNQVKGGDGDATLLTSITSINPLYCYVNIPERAFLKYQDNQKKRAASGSGATQAPCDIQLENETNFPRKGVIDFVDNHVDPATGTIKIRGVIPNTDGSLSPGLFARLRVPGSLPHTALLIPDSAVGTDQTSKYVLVLDKENTVIQKRVVLGAQFGPLRAISEGLTTDERVVVSGLQMAKPNTKVNPTEIPIAPEMLASITSGDRK